MQRKVPLLRQNRSADQVGALGSARDAETLGVVVVEEQQVDLPELLQPCGLACVEIAHDDLETVAFQAADPQRLDAVAVMLQLKPPVGLAQEPLLRPAGIPGQRRQGAHRYCDQLLGDPILVLQTAVGDVAGG